MHTLEHLRSGALVTVLDDYAGATMPIHVIWPRTRYLQPKVRVVVDALLEMAAAHSVVFGAHPQPLLAVPEVAQLQK